LLVANGAQGHVARKTGAVRAEATHKTIFLIGGDKQWMRMPSGAGNLLQPRGESKRLLGIVQVACKQNDTAYMVLGDQPLDLGRWRETVEACHEELAHLLLQRHARCCVYHR